MGKQRGCFSRAGLIQLVRKFDVYLATFILPSDRIHGYGSLKHLSDRRMKAFHERLILSLVAEKRPTSDSLSLIVHNGVATDMFAN